MQTQMRFWPQILAVGVAVVLSRPQVHGQASEYRGLWVGTVSLRGVNEVAIPLDEANDPVAPLPRVPTETFDEATLRLLVHVNGAGQVNLLKDVAILNRVAVEGQTDPDVFARESDLALVTDPSLYATYPPQPARRLASAVFDFGEAAATDGLDVMVDEAVRICAAYATVPSLDVSTQGLRVQAKQELSALCVAELDQMAEAADAETAFNSFLGLFSSADVDVIAADPSSAIVTDSLVEGETLRSSSFYADGRGVEMVNAVVGATTNAVPGDESADAQNTASAYADVANLYQRFISGKTFGDMIVAGAEAAGPAAKAGGADVASIEVAMRATPEVGAANTEAGVAAVGAYTDTRSISAVDGVLSVMASAALGAAALPASDVAQASETAGRTALAELVARYPLPVQTPSPAYTEWARSTTFSGAVQILSDAAATGAIDERAMNVLYSSRSVSNATRVAAVTALKAEYTAAARVERAELPMAGTFAPGVGDVRLVRDLAQPTDLGEAALTARIYLPAQHPTNPFRHRRHPDHTVGFDIERMIRLDFDGAEGDSLDSAAYGVDQISGTYREEIFGLHKPLGPKPDSDPIGLITEGRFVLNRISFIDTLNAR